MLAFLAERRTPDVPSENIEARSEDRRQDPPRPQCIAAGQEFGGIGPREPAASAQHAPGITGVDVRLVLIEWLDSYGCGSEWQPLEGCHAKPLLCRSVGWLVRDEDDCKVIVPHLSDSDSHLPPQGCGARTTAVAAAIAGSRARDTAAQEQSDRRDY